MNPKRSFIPMPLLILVGAVVAVALVAGGFNTDKLLMGRSSFDLASAGVPQAGQVKQAEQPGTGQAKGSAAPASVSAGSSFIYQGSLKSGGSRANGPHDFRFTLYDAAEGGNVVGPLVAIDGLPLSDGLFTTALDFGPSAFSGDARYLQIEVRQSGGSAYELLTPRQDVAPAPYAQFALKTAPQKNVVTVAEAGGQFTSIQAALDSITDASDTNRYVVRVAPGTYTERVTMKQYVDVEGSGENNTKIVFPGSPADNTGTVRGENNAELRSLSVENTGGSSYAIAIYNYSTSASLLQVTATASGAPTSYGAYGVYNHFSTPNMTNVTAKASGALTENAGVKNLASSPNMTNVTAQGSGGNNAYGVFNSNSSPTLTNVNASGSGGTFTHGYGFYNTSFSSPKIIGSILIGSGTNSYGFFSDTLTTGGKATIDSSKLIGDTYTIVNNYSGYTIQVGASYLSGGPVADTGPIVCAGVYDEVYVFYANTCP